MIGDNSTAACSADVLGLGAAACIIAATDNLSRTADAIAAIDLTTITVSIATHYVTGAIAAYTIAVEFAAAFISACLTT